MWAYDTITATLWFSMIPSIGVMVALGVYMLLHWPIVGLYALAVTFTFIVLTVLVSTYYIRPQNVISNAKGFRARRRDRGRDLRRRHGQKLRRGSA